MMFQLSSRSRCDIHVVNSCHVPLTWWFFVAGSITGSPDHRIADDVNRPARQVTADQIERATRSGRKPFSVSSASCRYSMATASIRLVLSSTRQFLPEQTDDVKINIAKVAT